MKLNKVYKSLVVAVAAFGAVTLLSLTAPKAYAADICWDGGGSTNNWSEDANWAGDTEPVPFTDGAVFDNTTCNGNPNKSVTIDVNGNSYTGMNIASYTGTINLGSNVIGLISFNQASGTIDLDTGAFVVLGNFTRTGGIFTADASTVGFATANATITGSTTFNNLTFGSNAGANTLSVASGTTLTVIGILSFEGELDSANDNLNGPGTIVAQGNIGFVTDGIPGNIPITLSGSANQTVTTDPTFTTGTITINKSSGVVTLGSDLSLTGTGQDLVISSGTLDMSTFDLTVDDVVTINGGLKQGSGNFTASNGSVTVGSTGWWLNNSSGDIDVEGGETITNNGYIRWDGTAAGCGGVDSISLTRGDSGTVSLAGSGRWRIYDVAISTTGIYAASPAITINSSSITGTQTGITNNGTCPSERTWIGSGNYNTGANWTGSTVPGTTELAVFDATSTDPMTINVNPDDNGFQINLGYSGTITQTNGVDITLDDQGWEQNAGTFTGGDATSDMTLNNSSKFTLTNGAFTAPGGTITLQGTVWTVSGGTFNANGGKVSFGNDDITITSPSTTYNDVEFTGNGQTYTISSGSTLDIDGDLFVETTNCFLNGPGGITLLGNIIHDGNNGFAGTAVITVNGTGTQTWSGGVNGSAVPGLRIDKPLGTFVIEDSVGVAEGGWEWVQGTVDATTNLSELYLSTYNQDTTFTGNTTFYDIVNDNNCANVTISSGTTITAANDITLSGNCGGLIDGPGVLAVQGDFSLDSGVVGSVAITFSGSNNQTLTNASGDFTTGTVTINKSSGTVTLASDLPLTSAGQDLIISSGILDISTFTLLVLDTATINGGLIQGSGGFGVIGNTTIGTTGWWVSNSSGIFTTSSGSTLTNNGYVRLDGTSAGCGDADGFLMFPQDGTANLAGSGRWRIYDVNLAGFSASPGITVYSSTNTSGNSGITFSGTCPSERTWIGSGNYNTAANWTGTAVPGATELAVFDATSTNNMTVDADPADNGFQINLGYSGTITQTNGVDITLDDQGWEQNAGTFTGGDATSDMTFDGGGDFVLNGGTFNAPGGTLLEDDNWTITGGSFNPGTGTVAIRPDDNTSVITGNATFYDLMFIGRNASGVSATVASGTNLTVTNELVLSHLNFPTPSLEGSGTITLTGSADLVQDGATSHGWAGDLDIIFSGAGDQLITGTTTASGRRGDVPSLYFDKSGGSVTMTDNLTVNYNFTIDSDNTGSLNFGSGTMTFDQQSSPGSTYTIDGSPTFGNVIFSGSNANQTTTITSGSVVTVLGDLEFYQGDFPTASLDGPGTIMVGGDLISTDRGWEGDIGLTLNGSGSQSINIPTDDRMIDGDIFINKTSGIVTLLDNFTVNAAGQDLTITDGTLANSTFTLTVSNTFTINDTFSQGAGNVSAGTYTIGASGVWENLSTGDIVVGAGGVANAGTITLGDVNSCEAADSISITSSSTGVQRSWTGAGEFNLVDLSVRDQGGSATLVAYSSTDVDNNDTNWTFASGCPSGPPEETNSSTFQGGLIIQGGTLIQ